MPLRDFSDRFPQLVQQVLQARRKGRLAAAYLIGGDDIRLLEAFSAAWIQTCVCEAPDSTGDACMACGSCTQLVSGTYPYRYEYRPVSSSRMILIDAIHELRRQLSLKSSGFLKVTLIVEADRMTVQAQNALLKTLEEPPGRNLFILLSQNPDNLLSTIRSRAQYLSLRQNTIRYDFQDRTKLCLALSRMGKGKGSTVGLDVSAEIVGLLDRLKQDAETEAKRMQEAKKEKINDFSSSIRKQLEQETQARMNSLYRARRDQIMSLLHTWFSQEYLRSTGVPLQYLSNQELYDHLEISQPTEEEAWANLQRAEKLVDDLNYNVKDDLHIQAFCLDICRKI